MTTETVVIIAIASVLLALVIIGGLAAIRMRNEHRTEQPAAPRQQARNRSIRAAFVPDEPCLSQWLACWRHAPGWPLPARWLIPSGERGSTGQPWATRAR